MRTRFFVLLLWPVILLVALDDIVRGHSHFLASR